MSNSYIQDLGATYAAAAASKQPTHSTSRKPDNTSLDMTDFLQLMVVQLQNQTMDNTTDTSDMLNQLVQMQMVTAMVNMTDASIVTYASSLVGKTVTVGVYSGKQFEEKVIEVMGTGQVNGEQVIFSTDGEAYKLSDIMAVGRLPDKLRLAVVLFYFQGEDLASAAQILHIPVGTAKSRLNKARKLLREVLADEADL